MQKPLTLTLTQEIKQIGLGLGFQQVGITDTRLNHHHHNYARWIEQNYHGEMTYMARNVDKRLNPEQLIPNTLSVICVRLDYLIDEGDWPHDLLDHHHLAYVSRYALGRDYHKLMRKRLQQYATKISERVGEMGYRVFTDSAPVLEKALAAKAGIGWQGKHSNILHRDHGSTFFLGEIYTDLQLDIDQPVENHCGRCTACIDVCPTQVIVAPYVVDARRCISYLTIEHKSAIPVEFRAAIGNRIYGCDDCQDVCPWNRFAKKSEESKFFPREPLGSMDLIAMLRMSRESFTAATRRSAIRRARYPGFLRNVAVALGNSGDPRALWPLVEALDHEEPLVRAHASWALGQLGDARAHEPLTARAEREEMESVREEIAWALERLDADLG